MTTLETTARRHLLHTAWNLRAMIINARRRADWSRADYLSGQRDAFRSAARLLRPFSQ
jgi:hypothetical protein